MVHRRRADGTAERARPAEADVVDQHDHDVGRALGRLDLEPRRRLGVARVEFGVGRRLGFRDRQHRAIWLTFNSRLGDLLGLLRLAAAAHEYRQGDAKRTKNT